MDIKSFFEGLQTTLTDALKGAPDAPDAPEGEAPTLESVSKQVDELAAKVDAAPAPAADPTAEDKDDAPTAGDTVDLEVLQKGIGEAVTAAITPLKETLDTHSEALEKALDRIARLEGGTATRKSATVDEAPGDGEPAPKAPEPKEALFKAVDQAIKTMQPVTFQ